jgi:hypothetical protein
MHMLLDTSLPAHCALPLDAICVGAWIPMVASTVTESSTYLPTVLYSFPITLPDRSTAPTLDIDIDKRSSILQYPIVPGMQLPV